MRFLVKFLLLLQLGSSVYGQDAWINEFHYDDAGADSLEFVEVMAAEGLTDLRVFLFNGATGLPYDSVLLDTLASSMEAGLRITAWFPELIQNGPTDGICLAAGMTVIQALAYEGSFISTGGSYPGINFIAIPTGENTYTVENNAVQLYGIGSRYRHFEWISTTGATPGTVNANQEIRRDPVIYAEITDSLVFDVTPYGHSSAGKYIILRGSNITGPVRIHPPQGFEVDTLEYFQTRASFGQYLELGVSDDFIPPTPVFVRFTPVLPDGLDHSGILQINEFQASALEILVRGTEGLVGLPRMWINEFHYDNESYDTLEFVEIALQHADRYASEEIGLHLYNGGNGKVYKSYSLDQAWQTDHADPSWDLYVLDVPQIQNGPDALALCYRDSCTQLISYEGTVIATDGPAFGQTSEQITVEELPDTPRLSSLQLMGSGKFMEDFTWVYVPGGHTMGYPNSNQVLPVRLLDYSAARTESGIKVDWHVAGESRTTGYQLEISEDGMDYDSIGWVGWTGKSTYRFSYHFPGTHYLRCSRIDTDNYYHRLFVLRMEDSPGAEWLLTDSDLLYHPYQDPTDVTINVYQANGQMIKQEVARLSGKQSRIDWLNDLSPGAYFLRIQTKSGARSIRFISWPR